MKAKRDWGHAKDYVEAMWLMLQQDRPDDFVICTGETHSVREFCEAAFSRVDLDWEKYVVVDERFLRPAEIDLLVGDYSKAADVLGWAPRTGFAELVETMVDADMEFLAREVASLRMSVGEVATRDFVRSELRSLLAELDDRDERAEREGRDERPEPPGSR